MMFKKLIMALPVMAVLASGCYSWWDMEGVKLLDTNDTGSSYGQDADGDGYDDGQDCDDADAAINPGADEYCDGIDNDCDGLADEDDAADATTWYADSDGDGYGSISYTLNACNQPTGYVEDGSDCDDGDEFIYPGADEVCNGYDDDCDSQVDDDDSNLVDASSWYADADNDGYGDEDDEVHACEPPSGYIDSGDDCDDSNGFVNPDAEEICDEVDNDCDGDVDEGVTTTYYADVDNDGYGNAAIPHEACDEVPYGYVSDATDCDDAAFETNPDAGEICDAADNNCDGDVDEGFDADGDGFPSVADMVVCAGAYTDFDCDDSRADIYPGAPESCDGTDYDCDGIFSEEATWYADTDSDGYGDSSSTTESCEAPSGYISDATDCDDTNATVYPGAEEYCNYLDDDCDGDTDESDAVDAGLWYVDTDADGFGDSGATAISACTQPSGHVSDSTDCDDTDASVNPSASEICDGMDNDCDGDIDESDAVDASTWYADSDGDSYGDASVSATACTQPSGYVVFNTDCDDTDAAVNPGADEYCNGYDDDCDSDVDEDDAVDVLTFYADADSDGYGDTSSSTESCEAPSGHVSDSTDCDDTDASVNPSASEICDGMDNDCDGDTDESDAVDAALWYADTDSDSFGDTGTRIIACTQPSGYVSDSTDCDDTDSAINPDVEEVCDSVDNDCDSLVDDDDLGVTDQTTWHDDNDGDGYGNGTAVDACFQPTGFVETTGDCDDTDATIYPGADEYCDGVDTDCDGDLDEDDALDATTWYADTDSDGYGDAGLTLTQCYVPSGYTADSSDCDDTDASINPGADEYCDGVDNDCDGDTDEGFDGDSDGYLSMADCSHGSDCDDTDPAINPGADEVCDSVDNDCDGDMDESGAVDATTWYLDSDLDGYGSDDDPTVVSCSEPSGYTDAGGDCDDSDADTNPIATDHEATVWDEDCNGLSGREVTSYENDVGDFLYPSGVSLVDNEDIYSTFVSGSADWTDPFGSSATVTSVTLSTIYSGTLNGIEMVSGSSSAIEGGCMHATPVSTLTPGNEYIATVAISHVGSMGSISWVLMSEADYSNYLSGSSTYTIYKNMTVGEEIILGGVFTATSASETIRLCAKDPSYGHEYDVVVAHLSIDEAE